MSAQLPTTAQILQGEAGSGFFSLLAVAHVLNNRMRLKGVPLSYILYIPGQFLSIAPEASGNANNVADMLEQGTLPNDITNGSLFYVTPDPSERWDGIVGATGPTTAAIIGAGNRIGPNYFSDVWGCPSDFFTFVFQGGKHA